jgi:predicted nucleotide-binding protein
MSIEKRSAAAQEIISNLRIEMSDIFNRVKADQDFDAARERLKRWKERAVKAIGEQISSLEAGKLRDKRKGSFHMGQHMKNLGEELQMYDAFLLTLSEELSKHPEDIFDVPSPVDPQIATVQAFPSTSRAVFIVHGHDELNVLRIKELLRDRWELEPIVLSGEPGKGRTIIEKFEEEAQRAIFALAVFTPDDVINLSDHEYAQARPNAIFELGWFYGRLGRNRVSILFKHGTKIHSDLDGISRVEFRDSVIEKVTEIERELLSAGVIKTRNS